MRIRMFKNGNPFRRPRSDERFAWFPKRLSNGTIVWLEPYKRTRSAYGGYARR